MRIVALLLACAALAGCARATPASFAAFTSELPWDEGPECTAGRGAPKAPDRYDSAATARALAWVYRDHAVEPWCGCAFDAGGNVLGDECGYVNPDEVAPAVAWMHVVPPSRFGVYRECWKQHSSGGEDETGATPPEQDDGARRHCARVDEEFRAMEADLYNFLPTMAHLAELRDDHPFGMVQGEPREFGACDVESQSVMGKSRVIEPPADLRGDIARTYFYMAARYGRGKDWKIKLSREQRLAYEKWAAEDPVDEWERRRACRIHALQGWENPFVK